MNRPAAPSGRTLSHYRIVAKIGAGGMGEVFRATDTRLGRDVAIKVLPPEVSRDPERLERFRREAQFLASLNHPNIAAIYGFEEAEGIPFLALELVEGEGLEARLARGAIPVDEALEIGRQIAEALEEAHGRGIIHRDLKPANVKLTPGGRAKVLDFGLAKAWTGDLPGADPSPTPLSQSPTLPGTGTMAGVLLGTAAYMSPEQARGKPVDRRADVWAFGVVLWEMLTGHRLFGGDTVTDVLAAVVTREPDLGALPAETPRAVRRLLGRCLRRDPRQRLPDIGTARLELQEVLAGAAEEEIPAGESASAVGRERRARARERWLWIAVVAAAAGLAAGLALLRLTPRPPLPPAARFAVDAPAGWSFSGYGVPVPSPDGSQIVFPARPDSQGTGGSVSRLWVRPLASLSARPLAGTEGATSPFWSPDGRFIGFFAEGELRRLDLAQGTVKTVCALPGRGDLESVAGADWNRAGTILFSAAGDSGQAYTNRIFTVPAAGGTATSVTMLSPARSEWGHLFPQFLPDGHRFLYLAWGYRQGQASGLYVTSLRKPTERREVERGIVRRVYAAGHLLFVRDDKLLALPFDPQRAAPAGEPVAIASAVASTPYDASIGVFAASAGGEGTGTLAYLSGGSATATQLAWLDRKGVRTGTVGEPGKYGQMALSPDGGSVALEVRDAAGRYDLWVMDIARGVPTRVTTAAGDENDPVWSPDGRSLAFVSKTGTGTDLRRKGLRAGDPEKVLADTPEQDIPECWSRDGRTILFLRNTPAYEKGVWAVPSDGSGKPELVLDTGSFTDEPQLSPDGRWLAYLSYESGRYEVYVEPFRRGGARVRVSAAGGGQPRWRGDGGELFYVTPARMMTAVGVRGIGDRLEVGAPAGLFRLPVYRGADVDDYAVSADGRRFLVKQPAGQVRTELHVITNWTSLLK